MQEETQSKQSGKISDYKERALKYSIQIMEDQLKRENCMKNRILGFDSFNDNPFPGLHCVMWGSASGSHTIVNGVEITDWPWEIYRDLQKNGENSKYYNKIQ